MLGTLVSRKLLMPLALTLLTTTTYAYGLPGVFYREEGDREERKKERQGHSHVIYNKNKIL
jgi:hypothetical protein